MGGSKVERASKTSYSNRANVFKMIAEALERACFREADYHILKAT
jgi:hypothetical protein